MLTKDVYVNLRGVLSKKIPWVDFGLVGWGVALIEKHKWCPTKRPLFHPLELVEKRQFLFTGHVDESNVIEFIRY
jgi:hypothetical protein